MKLGLTGGIGCGKSTVGKLLEKYGFQRIDSDVIVRNLLEKDAVVIAAIENKFGNDVLTAENQVDRPALAAKVFLDESALKWLESLLHPIVRKTWQAYLGQGVASNHVVEIPLLFEKELEKEFDFTACVFCSEAMQLQRLNEKGVRESQALARIKRQLPLESKVARADFALFNNGTLAFLERQVITLLKTLPS